MVESTENTPLEINYTELYLGSTLCFETFFSNVDPQRCCGPEAVNSNNAKFLSYGGAAA